MKKHDLPFHPLWEKGFTSIGCEPCTSLPTGEGGERSGRWAGLDKKECGIHTFLDKQD
jgi:phosphoadenosine phosphosulfate reductase